MSRQAPNILEKIREDLNDFVGQEIYLRANRGRKKIFEVTGVLEQTYPKVFVVSFRERQVERRVSQLRRFAHENRGDLVGDTPIGVRATG